MNLHTLVHFLKRHISDDVFSLLVANAVPLTGPAGLRRWVAERDVEAFAKLYFPDEFVLETPPIHLSFIRDIEDIRQRAITATPGRKLARAIPRGHAKTTFYSRLMPLHGLLFGWSPLTILLGNNQTAAERLLKNVRDVLETNEALQEDFGDTRGDVWQSDHIQAPNGCSIRAFGRGSGAIRGVSKPGQRPSLIVGDDLDDDALVRSAVELEAATEWWDKAVLALGDNVAFTTSFVAIGTVIRSTSLLSHVLASHDFERIVEQGVQHFSDHPELWEQWQAWYVEQAKQGVKPSTPAEDTFYQEHQAAMLAGTHVLWERPDGYYQMALYRLSRGDAAFASEIQNDPGSVGGALGPIPTIALPSDLSEWQLLAALDPTIKGGKTNDKAAWIEAYFHRRRKEVIIAFCNAEQRSASQTVEYVAKRLRQSTKAKRYDGLWVEANAAGTLIADSIEQRAQADGLGYAVVQVQNSAPKDERISILSDYAGRGQLYVADTIDPEFVKAWQGWPGYRWDDALDAAATIVMQLKKNGLLDLV